MQLIYYQSMKITKFINDAVEIVLDCFILIKLTIEKYNESRLDVIHYSQRQLKNRVV